MSQKKVTISSPDGNSTAKVLPSTVPAWERNGWTRVESARDDSAATLDSAGQGTKE